MQTFDYAVIGAGPGGYVSAIRAAQLGLKTVLIEKESTLGGTCLNVGCIPSKALLESSEMYHNMQHRGAENGLLFDNLHFDVNPMLRRKESIVKTLTDGIAMLMKKNKVTVIRGVGTLAGGNKIKVGDEEISATTIVLAMGSIPVELPFLKFDHKYIVDSTDALSFDKVPEQMVVIGGGAIGLELGSVWRRLGSEVTVIEMMPQIVPSADKQMAITLQRSLTSQGMTFLLDSKVTGATVVDGKVTVSYTGKDGKDATLIADKLLVAVGRKPNPYTAGLENAGVVVEKNGRIPVDHQWRTNVPGIFAIGDLIHGPMLAHKAEEEGVAVADVVAGKAGHVSYDNIPSVVYTHPEMACVGITEEEAKEKGLKTAVGKFFYRGNGRALSMGEGDGMAKIIADAETDRILGAHIVGARASDILQELVLAMEFRASAEDIASTVHAHPTLSEIVKEAAMAVDKRSIHS